MYLNHFGLSEAPFRITPHTDFFFAGANRGETLEALVYAITHDEGIIKVTGEVGSGKTMLCRVLMERLPGNVETVYLANPSLGRDEILLAILDDLKFPIPGERHNLLLRTLQEHLISLYASGKRVVLLIDEAHAMPAETLEQIRLLSNLETSRHKLLQIVLFAQQELDELLKSAQMRPLRERITHSFSLEPLVHADVGTYVMFRMRQAGYKGPDPFNPAAIKRLSKASLGLTRRINILADKALLAAFTLGEHGITAKHIGIAEKDSDFGSLGNRHSKTPATARSQVWLGILAAAAIVISLLGLGVFIGQRQSHMLTGTAANSPSAPHAAVPTPNASPASSSTQEMVVAPAAGVPLVGGASTSAAAANATLAHAGVTAPPALTPPLTSPGVLPRPPESPSDSHKSVAVLQSPAQSPPPRATSAEDKVPTKLVVPDKETAIKATVVPTKTSDTQPGAVDRAVMADPAKASPSPKPGAAKPAVTPDVRPKALEEAKVAQPPSVAVPSPDAPKPAEKGSGKQGSNAAQAKPTAPSWLNVAPMSLLEGRINATPAWLAQAPKGAHTLQLMSGSPAYMGEFDRWIDAAKSEVDLQKLYAFSSRTGSGGHRVSIVYGQFSSQENARAAVASLPDRIRSLNPSPRTISGIKSEIQNRK